MAMLGLGLLLVLGPLAPSAHPGPPQTAPNPSSTRPRTVYCKSRMFRIPFEVTAADQGRVKEVQLWVSSDGGAKWEPFASTTPDRLAFSFRAPKEGEYLFAVRTVDTKGRLFPGDDTEVTPILKVIVDTTPPSLGLDAGPRRGSVASVRWDIVDDHADLTSFLLEYQTEGASGWSKVPVRFVKRIGMERWDAGTAEPLRVRATVRDKAGNQESVMIRLPDGSPSGSSAPGSPEFTESETPPPIGSFASNTTERVAPSPLATEPPAMPSMNPSAMASPTPPPAEFNPFSGSAPPPASAPAAPPAAPGAEAPSPPILVSNPKFALQYEVEDAGPNGPASVELWVTQDGGQTWFPRGSDPDRTSPIAVDLGGEGTYGLKLVCRSAAKLGDLPPVPGEAPKTIVEVDRSGPVVKVDPPTINAGKLTVTWHASDAHPADRSVIISARADMPGATWIPITPPIDNSGKYVWPIPPNCPPRFHVRVDVVDALGNRGSAETTETGPVLVDRTRPKGRILGLDTGAKGPGASLGRARP